MYPATPPPTARTASPVHSHQREACASAFGFSVGSERGASTSAFGSAPAPGAGGRSCISSAKGGGARGGGAATTGGVRGGGGGCPGGGGGVRPGGGGGVVGGGGNARAVP